MADIFSSDWSETDSSNTVLWNEGMPPSSVNNSGRAMQGAVRRWFDWSNASVTSTGAANVQVITYTVAPSALHAGLVFRFIPGFSNTSATTVNINTLGAIPVLAYGQPLTGGEIKATVIAVIAYDGTSFHLLNPCPLMRTKLTASTTYYVDAATGDDTTGDGTPGTPWQTLQFAYSWIVSNIDAAGLAVTISQQGTDTTGLLADFPITGAPYVNLLLNGSINTSNAVGIRVFRAGGISLSGNGSITAANQCVVSQNDGFLQIGGVVFGSCSGAQIYAQNGGKISIVSSYSISGDAAEHWLCDSNSNITAFPASGSITVTLDGTRAFTTFALADSAGTIQCDHSLIGFSGSATGARYFVSTNSTIQTEGGGSTFFPGNSSGAADGSTFGVYQ